MARVKAKRKDIDISTSYKAYVDGEQVSVVPHASPTSQLKLDILGGLNGSVTTSGQIGLLCLLDTTGAIKDCASITWQGPSLSGTTVTFTGTATITATSNYTVGGYAQIRGTASTNPQYFNTTLASTSQYSLVTNQQVTVTITNTLSQSASSFSSSAGGTATIDSSSLLFAIASILSTGIAGATSPNAWNNIVASSMTFYSDANASATAQVYSATLTGSNVTVDTTNYKATVTANIAPSTAFSFLSMAINFTNGSVYVKSISTTQNVPSGVTSTITYTLQL